MLAGKDATVTLAVKDLQVAKEFYEGTLGLDAGTEVPGGLLYKTGRSTVLVYTSEFAGTNQATAASWDVGEEIERIVEQLAAKGVGFEHYDLPETTLSGDIHVMGQFKAAWFKDPDGNILALVNM